MPPPKKKVDGNNGVTKKKNSGKKRTLPTIDKIKWQRLAIDPSKGPPQAAAAAAAAAGVDAISTSCESQSNSCPKPPKLLNIPGEIYEDHSDPFHPLDHTNPEPPTNLALLSKVAAAINTDDDDDQFSNNSQSSQSMIQSVGRKGSFGHDEDNSKDPSYKQPELEDDDLSYSNDELLDAEFERGLDEVAHAIEWSDQKKTTMDVVGRHLLLGVLRHQIIPAWLSVRKKMQRKLMRSKGRLSQINVGENV